MKEKILQKFGEVFGDTTGARTYFAPGRVNLIGEHTDYNGGHVFPCALTIGTYGVARQRADRKLRFYSMNFEHLGVIESSLDGLKPEKEADWTNYPKGVMWAFEKRGFEIPYGMDLLLFGNIPNGSGLSSSAAYEILVATIIDCFFGGGTLDPVERAKVGQYAENVYFGKPCGLMDQMGSSVGGAVAIDFADPAAPVVKKVEYDFTRSGHALCIVDTGSCHADLTDDYADITREMGAVAAHFGKKFLRDVDEGAFRAALPQLRQECGDRAVLRTMHFFEEDCRAEQEAQALEQGDFAAFLALVDQSGLSSALNLQNTWSAAAPQQQAIPVALAVGRELLGGSGAIRVHGGGFAGTIQAFVPNEKLETFQQGMEELLGPGMCHILHIRPQGGCVVLK